MSIADLMAAMAAAGAPMEAIILAVRALEEKDAIIEARRASDRDRKRRQRSMQRDNHGTVTGQSRDADGTVTDAPLPPDKSPPDPQKLTPTPHTHGGDAPTREATPIRKAWSCPEGVDPEHWRDFLANRRRKRLATTDTAYAGQLRLIAEYACDEWPPGALVRKAAEKGWGTIVDPNEYGIPRNGQRPASNHRNGQPENPWLVGLRQAEAREAR